MPNQLKSRVMRKVFGFWFLRSMIPLLVLELLGIFVALYFFARAVFVSAVVHNALGATFGNPVRLIPYFWHAFIGAGIVVQILIVALLGGLVFVLRDINRSLISYALTRRSEFVKKETDTVHHE